MQFHHEPYTLLTTHKRQRQNARDLYGTPLSTQISSTTTLAIQTTSFDSMGKLTAVNFEHLRHQAPRLPAGTYLIPATGTPFYETSKYGDLGPTADLNMK